MWKGAAEALNARPQIRKHQAEDQADRDRRSRDRRIARAAREAVDQRRAVKQQARRQRAEHEILEARFRRLQAVAPERGQHVGRQAQRLDADIERHQVVGRQHHARAQRAEHDQQRILIPLHLRRLEEAARHEQRQRRQRIGHALREQREQRHLVEAVGRQRSLANAEIGLAPCRTGSNGHRRRRAPARRPTEGAAGPRCGRRRWRRAAGRPDRSRRAMRLR